MTKWLIIAAAIIAVYVWGTEESKAAQVGLRSYGSIDPNYDPIGNIWAADQKKGMARSTWDEKLPDGSTPWIQTSSGKVIKFYQSPQNSNGLSPTFWAADAVPDFPSKLRDSGSLAV